MTPDCEQRARNAGFGGIGLRYLFQKMTEALALHPETGKMDLSSAGR